MQSEGHGRRRGRHRLQTLVAVGVLAAALHCSTAAANGSEGVWTRVTPGYGNYYLGVDFIDNQNGWLVGEKQVILHTSNGGASWTSQHYIPDAYALSKVQMVDQNRGWAVGNGGAILFYNGLSWAEQQSPSGGPLEDLCFVGYDEGWIVGSSSKILHTTTGGDDPDDGGPQEGWSLANNGVPTGVDDIWFNGVDFSGTMWGWAVGEDYYQQPAGNYWASVYCTTNGGADWSSVMPYRTFISGRFNDVDFYPPSGLWVCGEDTSKPYGERGMIWHTDNPVGSSGWTRQTVPAGTDTLNSVHFATASLGWAVGDDVILVTTNAGNTWTREASPESYLGILNDVDSVDGVTAWAAGFGDRVMKRATDETPPVTTDDAPDDWENDPVTVDLTATDSGSGVAKTEYRVDGGAVKQGTSVYFAAPIGHGNDGDHVLSYWSTDKAGNVEDAKSCRIRIDTLTPRASTPGRYSVNRDRYVKLKYKITDAAPEVFTDERGRKSSRVEPRVWKSFSASLRLRNAGGKVVKTVSLGSRTAGVWCTCRVKASWRPAKYTYQVRATDWARNRSKWSKPGIVTVTGRRG